MGGTEPRWEAYAALSRAFYTPDEGSTVLGGAAWFAVVTGERCSELNVCGLMPGATSAAARELVAALAKDELPALIFRSSDAESAVGEVLAGAGFETAPTSEPLMVATAPPERVASPFRVARAENRTDIERGLRLESEAHHVDYGMLERTIGRPGGESELWLAWDDDEPVSAVWIAKTAETLGVMSMMTPARHQRRGAGRALLSMALNTMWSPPIDSALLISTPAGRRLYESIGFVVLDPAITSYRGIDESVLDAIGQPA